MYSAVYSVHFAVAIVSEMCNTKQHHCCAPNFEYSELCIINPQETGDRRQATRLDSST
jgi:hypothetical protein